MNKNLIQMRFTIALLPFILCLGIQATAQDVVNQWQDPRTCGTESTEKYLRLLKEKQKEIGKYEHKHNRTITQFPASIFIIRQSDGSGGLLQSDFTDTFSSVNAQLHEAGFELVVCDTVHYIDSDNYYDFVKTQENTLAAQYGVENTINIFIPNSITTGGGTPLCGYTYPPGWQDVMVIDRECFLNGSTYVHEVGHYFGLLHTHGASNVTLTGELVNFTNCISAGDDVCDTAADPNLLFQVDTNCIYVGNLMDDNEQQFDPDPLNYMSYAPKPCRSAFSEGQYNRMAYVAVNLRDYLTCPTLSADFTVDEPFIVCANQHAVAVTYTGIGANDWYWVINDEQAAEYNVSSFDHTFQSPGIYEICLTAYGENNDVSKCIQYAVQMLGQTPVTVDESFSNDLTGAILNPDMHHGWDVSDIYPNFGHDIILVDNYHYNAPGEEDYLIFGPVDLSIVSAPVLQFSLAYAAYDAQHSDGLRVEISTDCGDTFSEIYYASGAGLATVEGYLEEQWTPANSEDWRVEKLYLDDFTTDTIIVRFTNITDFGNNLYLDNIAVETDPLLDLKFLSFETLQRADGRHLLAWETVDEEKVLHYEIQISSNGLVFDELAIVYPQGALHNIYHYTHLTSSGHAFYRIKAHLDGKRYVYSSLRQIHGYSRNTAVYPNPVRNILHVQMGDNFSSADIMIYDISGRPVYIPPPAEGPGELTELDVSRLNQGIYTLIAGDITARFLKID